MIYRLCHCKVKKYIIRTKVSIIKPRNSKAIDEYVNGQKGYVFIKLIVYIILLIITCFLMYKSEVIEFMIFPPLFFIVLLIFFSGDLKRYKYIKKINDYITVNNLSDKMGNCLYWNEYDILLTEKFLFIIAKRNVEHFKYSDIKELYTEVSYKTMGVSTARFIELRYINILLFDDRKYRLLMYEGDNGSIELIKDITPILLEKNSEIKVSETKKL